MGAKLLPSLRSKTRVKSKNREGAKREREGPRGRERHCGEMMILDGSCGHGRGTTCLLLELAHGDVLPLASTCTPRHACHTFLRARVQIGGHACPKVGGQASRRARAPRARRGGKRRSGRAWRWPADSRRPCDLLRTRPIAPKA
eukprot:326357-Pleurochrysis_carterae.AAC.2